jgi:hypothetical protein
MMRFTHSGLECMTKLSPVGIPCGYVAVPESHPDYGKHYDDLEDIEVHGGLTFSGYWENLCDGLWYFGFDCGHADDIDNPPDIVPEYPHRLRYNKSMGYVERQTRRLAEQLAKR